MSKNFIYQYAKALFDLADSLETKTKFLKELRMISEALGNNDIAVFFASKDLGAKEKTEILDKVLSQLKVSQEVVNTVKLLSDRSKVSYLDQITLAYEVLNDEANGLMRGVVKSSHLLNPEQRSAIESKIQSVLNKKVILTYQQDPKVIGGLKAQVGSYTFDDTFETHLKKLKDQMNRSTN